LADSLANLAAIWLANVSQYDEEFLTTIATDNVIRPDRRYDAPCHAAQDLVSDIVAVSVVDLFEVIDAGETNADAESIGH